MNRELAGSEERGLRSFCNCPARLKDCSVLKRSQVFGCAYLLLLAPFFFFLSFPSFLPPLKSPVLLIRREGEDGYLLLPLTGPIDTGPPLPSTNVASPINQAGPQFLATTLEIVTTST